MAFDTPCPFPLNPGRYLTRDGAIADIFAVRLNFENRRVAIGCTCTVHGEVLSAGDWDAATGLSRVHSGPCAEDIIAMAIG